MRSVEWVVEFISAVMNDTFICLFFPSEGVNCRRSNQRAIYTLKVYKL